MPGRPTPNIANFLEAETRVGNNVVTVIDESQASDGIYWAQSQVTDGVTKEFALETTTLEDVFVRMTGHTSEAA